MNRFRHSGYLLVLVNLIALLIFTGGCGDDSGKTENGNGTTSGAESAPVPPRKADVIVFIRGGEVWAINPNNGVERQVTSDGKIKVWPRLSHEGKDVLYQVMLGDGSASGGIYRVPLAEGGTPEQLRSSGSYPAWSIDGKSIAFVRQSPAANNQQTDDIAIISVEDPSAAEQVITDHSTVIDMGGALAVQNLEYSPDGGKYIYFMRGRRSDSRWLARIEVATEKEEDVEAPPAAMPDGLAEGGFSLFNVSQMEGRRALVARGDFASGNFQSDHKLYIRFLEPQSPDSMIEEQAGSKNPSLRPDNTRFAYENNGVIYKHNLAGDPGIEKITDGGMPDWGMSSVGPGFDTDNDDTQTTTTTTTTNTGGNNGTDNTGEGNTGADCSNGPRNNDMVLNGDFEMGLADWQFVDIKKKGVNNVQVTEDRNCGSVLTFTRTSSGNDGGMSAVEQKMDVKRKGLSALRLRVVGAIDQQDLASDGWYGGETPLFVTVDYVNAAGKAKSWTHGLMTSGPVNYPDRDQVIPMGQWYQWDSPELLALLPDLDRVTKITIGGSGWDFKSRIGRVWLRTE